jgi:Tfp pilus assembly protein PilO
VNLTGTRPWIVGGVLAALLMAGLTWLLVVGPSRSESQSLRDDTASVQTQNDVLGAKVAALRAQAEDRTAVETSAADALATMPSELALPDFNRELAAHAAARGVRVTSTSVGAASGPTAGAAADPAGVLSVPVTIEASGARLALLYFLRDLQEVGPRAALVSSVSVGADTESDAAVGETAVDPAVIATNGNVVPTTITVQLSVFAHALSDADSALLADVVGSPDAG